MKTVTERALVMRLNRKLARDGLYVKTNSAPGYLGLGRFYLIDWNHSEIKDIDCNLKQLAMEFGVLHEEEEVAT